MNHVVKGLRDLNDFGCPLCHTLEGHQLDCPVLLAWRQAELLFAALEQVEWFDGTCPWCEGLQLSGHAPGCIRQKALGR